MTRRHSQSPVQIVGCIIWGLETLLVIGSICFSSITGSLFGGRGMMGSSMMGGSMMGGSSMMGTHWLIGLGTVWFIWRVAMQILAIFGILRLHDHNADTWPVILIVVGVLGGWLYLIPGIWGLIYNGQQRNRNRGNGNIQERRKVN